MPTIVFMETKEKYKSELGYSDYDEFEKLVKAHFMF
jgi:hypothetical protein